MQEEDTADYSLEAFLAAAYQTSLPKTDWPAGQFYLYQERMRQKLRSIMGLDKLQNLMKAKPDWRRIASTPYKTGQLESYTAHLADKLCSKLYLLKPEASLDKKHAVLYCHGHDKSAAETLKLGREGSPVYHKNLPAELMEAGYTVAVPEFAGYGKMVDKTYRKNPEAGSCFSPAARLLACGLSLTALRTWQAQKALDLLQKSQTASLSCYGISGGGLIAACLSALDARVSAAAIAAYFGFFKDSLFAMRHCIDNYLFNMLSLGEGPELLLLSAPKPLFVSHGLYDALFPATSAKKAVKRLKILYAHAQAPKNAIDFDLFKGGHESSPQGYLEWLDKIATRAAEPPTV